MVTKISKTAAPAPAAEPARKPARGKKAAAPAAPEQPAASASPAAGARLSDAVRDSAQQIWQAGLGAFTRAQTEGGKAFEALVSEGVRFQRKTQSAAEEKITEATQKMASVASDLGTRASGQWDKLEGIFEDRVARALNKLGVPSAKDVQALIARIDALSASVQALSGAAGVAAQAPRRTARKAAAASAPAASAAPVQAPAAEPVAAIKKSARKTAVRKAAPSAAASADAPTDAA